MPQELKGAAAVSQEAIFAYLKNSASYNSTVGKVDVIETHGAVIFLAGDFTYKIKKAIKLPYLDFSTLEKRHYFCQRELEINQPHAPDIYIGVLAITLEANGTLAIGGKGEPVEWSVRMRRFEQKNVFDQLPPTKLLETPLVRKLALAIFNYHKAAESVVTEDGPQRMNTLIDELLESFHQSADILPSTEVRKFERLARNTLETASCSLQLRGKGGFIRRCHGDLHLQNIVLMEDEPVLFDALEFDEELATIDTLYDLAFLLMDLDQCDQAATANIVLNRYLFHTATPEDINGLIAMPLFLSIRAGIRAMVSLDRAAQTLDNPATQEIDQAKQYFTSALNYLKPRAPVLIAIGGFSGTGKSTLAEKLAGSLFDHAPGLLHLRSDLERKLLFNCPETERLESECYTQAVSKQVYDRLLHKARMSLTSKQAVIVDAVFSQSQEREMFEKLAQALGVPFFGLWLTADEAQIAKRVDARKGDASDATPEIVHRQVSAGAGRIGWREVDASGSKEGSLAKAIAIIKRPEHNTNRC